MTVSHAQVTTIDSVFATNGQLMTPFPFAVTEVTTERLLALGGGGYLGVGSAVVPGFEIQGACAKFDVCGVPDATFGDNGFVYIPGGAGWQMKLEGAAELADGSFLIHGTTAQGFGAYSTNRPTLVKLSSDGQVDMSYATDGILRRDFPDGISCGFGTHFINVPDGKRLSLVIRDSNSSGGSPGLSLFRYLADGEPDGSFASGGAAHISKPDRAIRAEGHVIGDTMILVAYGRQFGDFSQQLRIELNAFDTSGVPITSFGINALVDDTTVFGGNGPWGYSSVLDDEDRLIIFGTTEGFENAYQLIRFLPDGSRDLSFGVNGRVLVPQLGTIGGGSAFATRLTRLQDGTLLCIGQVPGEGGIKDTQWFRLTADGGLIPGTNVLLSTELHAFQISDVVEITNGRLLAQARSQSPAPIAQVQMRFADPAVIMPHIGGTDGSLQTTGTGPGFQWQLDGNDISGATGTSYTPTENGTYTVEMTDVFGCVATSVPFELLNVGIPVINDVAISVLGPDANDVFTVRTDATLQYEVVDMRGARMGSGVMRQGISSITVQALPAGAYMLVLRSDSAYRAVRFAKL